MEAGGDEQVVAMSETAQAKTAKMTIPRPASIMIAGQGVSALGTGMVLPLTLIYLHQVRGISLPVVGALLAMGAVVGLVAVPVSGAGMDRVGARKVLMLAVAGQAVTEASLTLVHNVATAMPALVVLGLCQAPTVPAFLTMMAGLCPEPAMQQRAFAISFTVLNAGIGIGGAIGAAVVSVRHPGSFQLMFLGSAVCCLLFGLVLSRLPDGWSRHEAVEPAKIGYRDVLANRALRAALFASLLLAFTGYPAVDSGLPAFATVEAHAQVRIVALALTVNTALIVGAQLLVLRLLRKLRRSQALAMTGLIWALAWAVFGASALPLSHGLRIFCVLAFAGLFGVGETFMAPTVSALVNSLADDRTRGRANALSSGTLSVTFVVSPAISTTMIAAGLPVLWIGLLCAGCLSNVILARDLRGRLTVAQDLVDGEPAPVLEPVVA